MLKILERNYKQSEKDILNEFPNSQFVMRVDGLLDDAGYLLAASTAPESSSEFWGLSGTTPTIEVLKCRRLL